MNAEPECLDFLASLGPEPAWVDCSQCGTRTSLSPCWECTRALEAKRDRTERCAASSGTIPKRYAWASLSAPELVQRVKSTEQVKSLAIRILAAHSVVLVGSAGSGKTSLGVACLRERIPDAMYISSLRLGTARIQNAAGQGEAAIVERAMSSRLLLIDDIGQVKPTATDAVKDVVFARHEAELPTWVTTGCNSAQLVELYGDGFVRRLIDGALVIRLGTPK